MNRVISTSKAPKAIGPYSQAVVVDGILYSSGQIGLKPNGELVADDIESQTRQVLENLKAILFEAGTNLDRVIKTTIYLDNMDDFMVVNRIYEEYFGSNKPARSTVAVDKLPKGVKIEIECIAKVD